MTTEQFSRELNYRVALSITGRMLMDGLISQAEYQTIDTMLAAKFRPVFGALSSDISLIQAPF